MKSLFAHIGRTCYYQECLSEGNYNTFKFVKFKIDENFNVVDVLLNTDIQHKKLSNGGCILNGNC